MSRVYLALPYSGQEEKSFRQANRVAARLMDRGHVVFSPISHSHSIGTCRGDYGFWMKQDLPWLDLCDLLVVLRSEGWEQSKGVQAEIAYAHEHCIATVYIDPMPTLIGLCAPYPHAGKSTLARNIAQEWGHQQVSFADPMSWFVDLLMEVQKVDPGRQRFIRNHKEDAFPELFGRSVRDLKRTLGTEWGRTLISADIWLDVAKARLANQSCVWNGMVIDDVRFDNEAEWIRKAGGVLVRLERPEAAGEVALTHASDTSLTVEPHYTVQVRETPEETLAYVESLLMGF